ncbi:hypothetical protein BVC80_7161g2 [Macleaya cordata]|uniref:Retrotransposon Copia-like N-terminal domain-containing protein n=1 Tax=Macleaya cordata TaxID=56857 RepID=A0A200QN27_MACCD|nr:hypothetical protein BVC80_7161g2 [Macleaya cordata]
MAYADSSSSSAITPAPVVVSSPSTMAPTTPFYSHIQLTQVQHLVRIILDEHNYVLWKTQFLLILEAHDLDMYVDGTLSPPPTWILSSLSENVVARVFGLTNSHEVWDHLAQLFSSASEARLNQIRRELQTIRKGSLTMHDYFLKAKKLSDALATSGKPVSNYELQSMLLSSLDTAYDAIVTTLTATLVEIPLTDFQAHLLAFEMRLHHQSTALASTTMVNMVVVHDSSSPSPSH